MLENRPSTKELLAVDVRKLMYFYDVDNVMDLARIQAYHIEKMQAKLFEENNFYGMRNK